MPLYQRIRSVVSSRWFMVFVVVLLVIQAVWIALSGRFPMAFDEEFHLGIIKIYADRLSPFFTDQPPNADMYGAVYRDPSYLYHYLMSFPYRLIRMLFGHETNEIVALRLINVGLFAAGLVLFRKALLQCRISPAIVHVALLFLVLTPVTPMLAGQLNYDNLLFPLVGLTLWLAVLNVQKIKNSTVDARLLMLFATVGMLAGLVKYAFLPIFAACVMGLVVVMFRRGMWRKCTATFKASFAKLTVVTKVAIVGGLLISSGLFIERYAVNTFNYLTPTPECNQVLSVEQCLQYGPWARNYRMANGTDGDVAWDIRQFTSRWQFVFLDSMFYALNGKDSGYVVGEALLFPEIIAVVAICIGLLMISLHWRSIYRRHPELALLGAVALTYMFVIWLQNYLDFKNLGQPVALQGRYLMQVLPILLTTIGVGFTYFLRGRHTLQLVTFAVIGFLFLQGAGILTFLVRSDNTWYFEHKTIVKINQNAQDAVKPFIIGQ